MNCSRPLCRLAIASILAISLSVVAVSQTAVPKPAAKQVATTTPATAPSTSSRAPIATQGVGTFLWPNGWTLIVYGCFRNGTRLFCDFDTTNQNNLQAGSNIWDRVNLVDDGGKITGRHNAFFVGEDGSQFPTAYIGSQPVRFVMEYDDIDQRYTSVSLVCGRDRIQGVPIALMDANLPAGKIPTRAFAPASSSPSSTGTQQAAAPQPVGTDAVDKASNTVNNAGAQKKKAQSLWKSLQSTVQSH